MSKSPKVKVTCEFHKIGGVFQLGDNIDGKIIVQPQEHIKFQEVLFESYWSISDGSRIEKLLLQRKTHNPSRKYWQAGRRHELSFSFPSQSPLSYSSKERLKIDRYLIVRVTKSGHSWSYDKKPEYLFSQTFTYLLNPNTNSYEIEKRISENDYNSFFPYLVLPIGVGLLGSFHGLPLMDLLSAGIFGKGLHHTFVGFGKLGKVKTTVSPFDNANFQVELNIQRNWSNIQKIKLGYYISYSSFDSREKSILLHRLHYSDITNTDSHIMTFTRPYPSINLPPVLETNYFDIFWHLKIVVELKNGKEKMITIKTPMNIVTR